MGLRQNTPQLGGGQVRLVQTPEHGQAAGQDALAEVGVRAQRHRVGRTFGSFLVFADLEMGDGHVVQPDKCLRIVRIQAQAALQGLDRLRGAPGAQARDPEDEMAQSEARAQVDGALGRSYRPHRER